MISSKIGETNGIYSQVLAELAETYRLQTKKKEAEVSYIKALEIQREIFWR